MTVEQFPKTGRILTAVKEVTGNKSWDGAIGSLCGGRSGVKLTTPHTGCPGWDPHTQMYILFYISDL